MQALQQAAIFAADNREPGVPEIGISIKKADSAVLFEQSFKDNFKRLHAYACTILNNEADAEEMVQQVFCKLWEKKEKLQEIDSITAYLYRSVHNECMNFVKHQKVKDAHREHSTYHNSDNTDAVDNAAERELKERLHHAMQQLPEQCRTIFQMSRFEELKYREIADKLGLSVKTIENQMGKALKIMRKQLADYITVLWLFLNLLN